MHPTEVSIACGKSARSRGSAPPATMALLFGDGLAYEWGTDWPETFDVLSMSKQHRPLSQKLSPLGVMEELNKLYYMARPRPGKPQAKPMPADLDGHTHEGEMETTSRKKAQKAWHHDQSGPGFAPPNGPMAAAHAPDARPLAQGRPLSLAVLVPPGACPQSPMPLRRTRRSASVRSSQRVKRRRPTCSCGGSTRTRSTRWR